MTKTLPPLHVHLLAHPRSEAANGLARALMARLVEPPASGGLRIPTFFTPDCGDDLPPPIAGESAINIDAASHTLIVVLADTRMLRTIPSGTGGEWQDFVRQLRSQIPLDASPHHLLPVAIDHEGFRISDQGHVLPALLNSSLDTRTAKEQRLAELSFHVAARALQLLEHGRVPAIAPNRMKAPVCLFLSHAKADLDPGRNDPVRHTAAACDDEAFPIEKWFDARNIATSQDFQDAIQAGIRDCSIMVAFKTDHYSARPWCRREVLEAKRLGAHILVVNALETLEPRSFPYGGNVPVIRWNLNGVPAVEARRVIDRAVLEALRFKHNRAVLETEAEAGDILMPAPPEALMLADISDTRPVPNYLYPDPPLGREELEVLQKLRPGVCFVTPLTRLAARSKPRSIETLCVSISESGDTRRYGLSDSHFATLSDEIHLYLLLSGLRIAYGGALTGDFAQGDNFTLRLFELVRGYSKLAEGVGAPPLSGAILNIAPWPLRLTYGDSEWGLFHGEVARYQEGPRPDLPWDDDELFPGGDGLRTLVADTPRKRYAWARGLTAMRQAATTCCQARLVLGGKMTGFTGLVPGVVEEAWMSISQEQPLYLAGGFGGAARAICDMLSGTKREEFSDTWIAQRVPDYSSAIGYQNVDVTLNLLPQIGEDIAALAGKDLGQVLKNGLDDAENRELMNSTEPRQIAELVLRGLGRL